MSILSRVIRAVGVIGVALPLAVVASAPASASPADPWSPARPTTPFLADHTHACVYSIARGDIDWNAITIGGTRMVHVKGSLAERTSSCNGSYPGTTFATFTARIEDRAVDERTITLGNSVGPGIGFSVKDFDFTLSSFEARGLIDQVDVQVCRDLGPMLPAITCGDLESYYRPRLAPAE